MCVVFFLTGTWHGVCVCVVTAECVCCLISGG